MADDISRNNFDPARHYLGVRLQQGRVWVDADFNEQAEIIHHRLKEVVADVVGGTGAPAHSGGFAITSDNVLHFDGRHAAFTPPQRELRFADGPFLVEVCCAPSPAGDGGAFGGTLLYACDTQGREHFLLALGEDGSVLVRQHGVATLVAPAHWRSQRLLRVAFDGFNLSVNVDGEHAGHVHLGAEDELLALQLVTDELGARRAEHQRRQLPVALHVGMGLLEGKHHNGFRGAIESIRILGGSDDSAPAIAWWRLDEGLGTLSADSSGHGHHLQLDYGDPSAHPRWQNRSLTISPGRFYVGGLACHAPHRVPLPLPAHARGTSLVYLDVWERVVTAAEEPGLRDPALGGADTAARLQLQHRVRTLPVAADPFLEPEAREVQRAWRRLLRQHESGVLRVRSSTPAHLRDGYYRIEIHHGGGRREELHASGAGCRARLLQPHGQKLALSEPAEYRWEVGQWCTAADWSAQIVAVADDGSWLHVSEAPPESLRDREFWLRPLATFKWSRNNGSDQWPVQRAEARGASVLPVPGRRLHVGDLIEVTEQARRAEGRPGALSTVTWLSDDGLRLKLSHPLPALGEGLVLTRWHGQALLPASSSWTPLEHGLSVQFGGRPHHLSGEGWGFATREADGSLDWPLEPPAPGAASTSTPGAARAPAWQRARDGRHRLARLALLQRAESGVSVRDLRRTFAPLSEGAAVERSGPRERHEPRHEPREHQPEHRERQPEHREHRPPPPSRRTSVETIRHIGRETQIDDGVIHSRQLAADVGVVPLHASILSEHAQAPRGFRFTGQSLRLPHHQPRWHGWAQHGPPFTGRVVLLELSDGLVALQAGERIWHLPHGEQRWRAGRELPRRARDFAAVVHRNTVHLVGGREGHGPPLQLHWALERGEWREHGALRVARAQPVLAVLDGQLLALGGLRTALVSWRTRERLARWGISPSWFGEHGTCSVELYDDELRCWRDGPDLPAALAAAAGVVRRGRLHLLGGRHVPLLGRARCTRQHLELATASGSWVLHPPLPEERAAAAASLLGEDIVLLGGEDDRGPLASVQRSLQHLPQHWLAQPPLPRPRSGAGLIVRQGALACVGGVGRGEQPEPALHCTLEDVFFVHRRCGEEDLASGDLASAEVVPPLPAPAPASPAAAPAAPPAATPAAAHPEAPAAAAHPEAPAAAAPAAMPGAGAASAAHPSSPPAAATPAAAAGAAPPAASPAAAPPAAAPPAALQPPPAAAAPASAPAAAPSSPPSSLSATVAPASAVHPHLPEAPQLPAPPSLGLSAPLAKLKTKLKQLLPVVAAGAAAGLIGSGRAPELLHEARERLGLWLLQEGGSTAARPDAAGGATGSGGTNATASSASSTAASGAGGAPGSTSTTPSSPTTQPGQSGTTPPGTTPPGTTPAPATPLPPGTQQVDGLVLGDPSAPYAQGVDVSHYQGDVPWTTLADHGIDYAFTKATQGTSYVDPRFSSNWAAMRNSGILRGAYHVWEPDQDPVAQGKFFSKTIGKDVDLPPVLDIELVSRKKKCAEMLADVQKLAETVEQELGQVVAIYSYGGYWNTYLSCDSDPKGAAIARNLALRPLWVADYEGRAEPQLFGGHLGWDFWQFTNHGNDRARQLDLDRFNGGPQDLRRWLTRRMRPPVR